MGAIRYGSPHYCGSGHTVHTTNCSFGGSRCSGSCTQSTSSSRPNPSRIPVTGVTCAAAARVGWWRLHNTQRLPLLGCYRLLCSVPTHRFSHSESSLLLLLLQFFCCCCFCEKASTTTFRLWKSPQTNRFNQLLHLDFDQASTSQSEYVYPRITLITHGKRSSNHFLLLF